MTALDISPYLRLTPRSEQEVRGVSFQTRQKTAEYARKVAGQMFGKRVSTIFDPRYGIQPWCAYWDDARDETPEFMGRGKTAAEAIRKLIVITKAGHESATRDAARDE